MEVNGPEMTENSLFKLKLKGTAAQSKGEVKVSRKMPLVIFNAAQSWT
jgi:hypothetical protein